MLPAIPSNSIITAPTDRTSVDPILWLAFFDPQAALQSVINHVETLAGSAHERHTMRAYLASLADFCRFAGAVVTHAGNEAYTFDFSQMQMPTKVLLQNYVAHCKKRGLSSATVTRYLAAVRRFLRGLNEQLVIPRSIADSVFITEARRQFQMASDMENPASDRSSNRPALEQYGIRLSLERVNQVFSSFAAELDTVTGQRDLALLYLGITSGLRAAELARLTLDNITPGKGYYEVRVRGKRSNYDPVGIDRATYDLLMQYVTTWNTRLDINDPRRIVGAIPVFQPLLRGDHLPIIGLRGYAPATGLSARAVLKIVDRRTYEALGIAITAHDMRRTCAALMRSQGFQWDDIRAQLRHRSIGTTEKYVGQEQDLSKALLSNRANFAVPHSGN